MEGGILIFSWNMGCLMDHQNPNVHNQEYLLNPGYNSPLSLSQKSISLIGSEIIDQYHGLR